MTLSMPRAGQPRQPASRPAATPPARQRPARQPRALGRASPRSSPLPGWVRPSSTDTSPRRRGPLVTAPHHPLTTADIDLSDVEFWGRPAAERQAAFAALRSLGSPPFFREPESPFPEQGPGYYALVRYADVVEASRNPEVFSSGRGATSVLDLPVEFNEYFGSMINMDDPRHARLRRLGSRAF